MVEAVTGATAAGIGLAVLSGLLAALTAPPYPASFLIFVAFVPLLVAQYRLLPARWSALAPGVTCGVWLASQLLPGLVEARVAASIHPLGRVIAKVVDPKGRASTMLTDLPSGPHNRPYVFLGDGVGWLTLALAVVLHLNGFCLRILDRQ